MREDWEEILYKDAVYKISTTKQKLKQKEYSQLGEYPIIDQGQEKIGGYSDDKDKILDCKLPVLVFGDHTKCVKLINFKFIPGADGTKVLEPKQGIEPKYISTLTHVLVHKIKDKGYARHYQHIEKENLPLAPLPEQRAIVAKIEELFSDLDKGVADLKKAQDQLKVYRQAVLKKAFEGDWKKVELESACDKVLKIKRKEMSTDKPLIYLDIGAIDNTKNVIVGHKEYIWENAPSRAQQIVKVGDVLFSTVRTYLKNIARVEKSIYENEIASTGFTVIRGKKGILNSKFIFFITTSQFFLEPLNKLQRGTSYPAVRDKDVFSQLIPLPSIPEQEKIVQEIESRLSVCDKVEENISESLDKAKALRQSILKKAFEGNLLSTQEIEKCKAAPDYEPAAVLLEKIKNL